MAVERLRLRAFTAVGWGSVPSWELRFHKLHGVTQNKKETGGQTGVGKTLRKQETESGENGAAYTKEQEFQRRAIMSIKILRGQKKLGLKGKKVSNGFIR